jgi:hypothetical protein
MKFFAFRALLKQQGIAARGLWSLPVTTPGYLARPADGVGCSATNPRPLRRPVACRARRRIFDEERDRSCRSSWRARPVHPEDLMRDNNRYPTDIVMDAQGRWRALYSDGSLGPPLTLDEMLDELPFLREAGGEVTDTFE